MKKRILVLTSRYPYPVVGGDRLRIYEICKALSSDYNLTLLSLCDTHEELRADPPIDDVFERIERVYLPPWMSYLNCLKALPFRLPLQIAYYQSKLFRRRVNELSIDCDLVLFHLVRLFPYVKDLKIPVVGEFTDAISMNYERVCQSTRHLSVRGIIYAVEQPRILALEQEAVQSVDASFFVSAVDVAYLERKMQRQAFDRIMVCSNGVDLSVTPSGQPKESKTIIFIGNLVSLQNFSAALWFAELCMPILLRRDPQFKFRVIGRIRERDKARLLNCEGVEVTGEVSEVPPYCRDAGVAVCPVWQGAGIQNKVLEYMALGIPCVTSPIGLEGLEAVPNRDLLVGNASEEFANNVFRICTESSLREQLSRNGRRYVEAHHSWYSKLAPFRQRINELLSSYSRK